MEDQTNLEQQSASAAHPKPYEDGNGEGVLMFWCVILVIASLLAGVYVSTLTVSIPSRTGLFTEEVPLYGVPGGIAVALSGLSFSSLFYGLSKAIRLLKFIAANVDNVRKP